MGEGGSERQAVVLSLGDAIETNESDAALAAMGRGRGPSGHHVRCSPSAGYAWDRVLFGTGCPTALWENCLLNIVARTRAWYRARPRRVAVIPSPDDVPLHLCCPDMSSDAKCAGQGILDQGNTLIKLTVT